MACSWFLSNARWVVTVGTPTRSDDDYGGQTITYSNTNYFCVLEPLGGKDEFDFEASEPKVRHKATIRYVAALANVANIQNYKFTIDGREFRPLFVKNLDASRKMYGHQYLEITLEDNGAVNNA